MTGRLIDIQYRLREIGRIRTGDQVPTNSGKMRPNKLDHFRLTSHSRDLMESVAGLYGGAVQEWNDQWEVYVGADTLDIVIPPANALSQTYELWQAGGCKRRCDGQVEQLSDKPCLCDPDSRECKPITRLKVMFPRVAGLGVWRLESGGYNAAAELGGLADILAHASAQGIHLPAVLRLEQRETKRPGPDGKTVTRKFAVPVIDINVPLQDMLGMLGSGAVPERPALRAAPEHPAAPAIEAPKSFKNFPDQPTWPAPPPPPSPNRREPGPQDEPPAQRDPLTDVQRFAMQCREAGFDDEGRHTFIEELTAGRTRSSKDLTADELAEARARLMEGVRTSTLAMVEGDTDKAKVAALLNLSPNLPRKGKWTLDDWLTAYASVVAQGEPVEEPV
jgi:hypothetical protein